MSYSQALSHSGSTELLNKIFVANPSERATLEDLMEDEWVKGEIES